MRKYKIILLGVSVLLFAIALIGAPQKAFAVTTRFTSNPFTSNYYYKSGKITTVIASGTAQQQTLTFTNTSAKPLEYNSDAKIFCTFTSPNPSISAKITISKAPGGASFSGNLTAWYFIDQGCSSSANGSITITNQDTGSGGSNGLPPSLTYNGNTYSLISQGVPVYGLNKTLTSDCYGGSVIVANNDVTKGSAYLGLKYFQDQQVTPLTPLSRVLNQDGLATSAIVNLIQGCGFPSTAQAVGYSGSITNGHLNAAAPTDPTDPSAPTQTTCEKNSGGWDFSWAVCPILDAASGLSNVLVNLFEDQLSFSVNQLGTSADQVHQSWALIRDIATALVVVVMLVMVFSQAASFGPFDAYTVRKLLPRLVAVVILIQISWIGAAYVVDLVNAIANGIADLMYYPFGGAGNMDLFALLGHAKLGGVEAGALSWAAMGVAVALAAAFLFSMLGVAFVAIVALFFAILTLIFRKVLIILLIVFAPLALLAWVLPGTERYWKLWRENFIKVLFMFPIVVAIIASGRVFAYVIGGQNNSEFLNLLFILVGFFGPLFILPRTFKWGGQAMQAAGNGIMKASSKVSERPKKFLDTRQEEYTAERRRQSQERYQRNQKFDPKKLTSYWRRPVDLLRSGESDITRWGRRKDEAMRNYRAAGVESEEKEVKAADQDFGQLAAQSTNHDELARLFAGAKIDSKVSWKDRFGETRTMTVSAAMKRAGMNGISRYGTDRSFRVLSRVMDELNHGTQEEQILAERFRDQNASTLLSKMNTLYRGTAPDSDAVPHWNGSELSGPLVSRVSALSPGAFAQMEAPDLEAMLAGLSQVANHHTEAAARAEAASNLQTIVSNYEQAINNEQIRPNLGPSLNQAMKAFLDGTNRDELNRNRTVVAGLATTVEQVEGVSTPTLGDRISADGVVSPTGPPTQAAPTVQTNVQTSGGTQFRQTPEEGVLYVQPQPNFQPGDTVRPVPGTSSGIVIPPGTRSTLAPRHEEPPTTPPGS